MLGLGLGLNKESYIKPLPKWLTDAGCTFAINVDRQVKALANPNSPFINPLEDVGYAKKFNITQIILNGDFANGTTGWSGVGATLSASNKIMSVTGNGTTTLPNMLNTTILISNIKYFFKCRVRVTNTLSTAITIGTTLGFNPGTINMPVQNQWYDLFGINTPTSTTQLRIRANYPDAATANGKVMEVDGNVGVFAIPLTGTPYENYTADKMNALITEYFEGEKEVSEKLTALLQGFAGTTADGYTRIALPNGKNPWFLKFDGTDSLGMMANTADVDILSVNDFAISTVFRTPSVLNIGYVISKTLDTALTMQYGFYLNAPTTEIILLLEGVQYVVAPTTSIAPNTLYEFIVFRKSGVLKAKLNKLETYSAANNSNLTSRPNTRIGAMSSNAGGATHAALTNINLGNLAIFYNGATGLDIAKVEKAVAKLNANYI